MNDVQIHRTQRTRHFVLFALVLVMATGIGFAMPAHVMGAEIQFMGETVTPSAGKYLVEKDVNVRAAPKTSGKRIDGLKAGDVVNVVGRVGKTAWLAVVKDGKPYGFVYGTVLSPIIDGGIEDDVTGEIRLGADHRCGFRVHFIGKAGGEDSGDGQDVRSADYDVSIVCERRGERIRFPAQMFMTEVPFDGSNKRQVFQINLDLLDGVHGLVDVFSTIMMFDLDKGEVRYDSVAVGTEVRTNNTSADAYVRKEGGLVSLPSTSVSRALLSAIEIALTHWSDAAWDDIFRQAK